MPKAACAGGQVSNLSIEGSRLVHQCMQFLAGPVIHSCWRSERMAKGRTRVSQYALNSKLLHVKTAQVHTSDLHAQLYSELPFRGEVNI